MTFPKAAGNFAPREPVRWVKPCYSRIETILETSNPLGYDHFYEFRRGFPVDMSIKTLPVMQEMKETRVPSWGWEDSPGEERTTHSRILAWRIPWTEEPGRLRSMKPQRVGHDWASKPRTWIKKILDEVKEKKSHRTLFAFTKVVHISPSACSSHIRTGLCASCETKASCEISNLWKYIMPESVPLGPFTAVWLKENLLQFL